MNLSKTLCKYHMPDVITMVKLNRILRVWARFHYKSDTLLFSGLN